MQPKPGVLGFQGDIEEHQEAFQKLGLEAVKVLDARTLDKITHLVIPGGESTVIGKFLESSGLDLIIQNRVKKGSLSVYGTCAGAILLAKNVKSKVPISNLKLIDISVDRNAYGSQKDSFSTKLKFLPENLTIQATFIRAPIISEIEAGVEILGKHFDEVVIAKQDNILISTFHPELNNFPLIHKYFLNFNINP